MAPWLEALIGSALGGALLATVTVFMGLRRLEALRGVRFSPAQRRRAWWAVFGVFTAFGFFLLSLTPR